MNNCIFMAFDDGYFTYARACLNSFAANYEDHPRIIVFYVGENPSVVEFVRNCHNVELLPRSTFSIERFENLNLGLIGSPIAFVRLLLWSEPFFDQFDNIVYIDSDTVILKPFNEVFQKTEFYCVSDNSDYQIFDPTKLQNPTLLEKLQSDEIDLVRVNSQMANSGFFVLPKVFRRDQYARTIWHILETYESYIQFCDQSVISIWCYLNGFKMSTDFEYNFQTAFIYRPTIHEFDLDSIKIMHFSCWKPYKNFQSLLGPARYIIKAMDTFDTMFKLK